VKKEHIEQFLEEESIPDFMVQNLLTRMKKAGMFNDENGYDAYTMQTLMVDM